MYLSSAHVLTLAIKTMYFQLDGYELPALYR